MVKCPDGEWVEYNRLTL